MVATQNLPAILDNEALRRSCPSIFASTPYSGMSARYRMVPTIEVVDILRDRGFRPVKAVQNRARTEDKRPYSRHMIRFRHDDYLTPETVGGELPELILSNSHDGSAAYRFNSGIYRLVCSNGLLIAAADFGGISVKHSGGSDFHDRILDATFRIVEDTPKTLAKIEDWKQIALPAPIQTAYAEAAHTLLDNPSVKPAQLLTPRRVEDKPTEDGSRSLWVTYNTVQEHVLKGGDVGFSSSGRRTTTRPVKSVERDLKLNRALATLAEQLAKHMA